MSEEEGESAKERIMLEQTSWHQLEVEEVEKTLETAQVGLSAGEADVRVQRFGQNVIVEPIAISPLRVLLSQFKSPVIYILLLAMFLTILVGEEIDTIVILVVVVFNSAIGFFQEYKAETSMKALLTLSSPRAHVVRDGQESEIDSANVVPGDIVLLYTGSRVPADLRITQSVSMEADESLLTGESVPVRKRPEALKKTTSVADMSNMAFAGTTVTRGRGRGIVVSIGRSTQLGKIGGLIAHGKASKTPLQNQIAGLGRSLAILVLVSAVITTLMATFLGVGTFQEAVLISIALAVSAVPEGLPVAVTIALSAGMVAMAREHVIIRRLLAVETLGSCTAICSDKTGTMTKNEMTVSQIRCGGNRYEVTGTGYEPRGEITVEGKPAIAADDRTLYLTLLAGVLCNESTLFSRDDQWQGIGDPTEIALLTSAAKAGLKREDAEQSYVLYDEIPFDPEARFAATYHKHDDSRFVFVKGAPEVVLEMSSSMLENGKKAKLEVEEIRKASDEVAAEGLRVLAMAYREYGDAESDASAGTRPGGLVFLGLQGMLDPPREEVIDAIAWCNSAGIKVSMVTGDHKKTAVEIAKKIGIEVGSEAVEGAEISKLSESELRRVVTGTRVFARTSPEHKLRIVNAMKANHEVVAVTGDGANDAPALRAANIGVAMGRKGTDVAKEASDMVITDDNFASIKSAVERGRVVFHNVRKVTFLLVSTGVGEVLAVMLALASGLPLPFSAVQLLWLNLVTNGVQDVALALEPGEAHVSRMRPRNTNEGILSDVLVERTMLSAAVFAVASMLMYYLTLSGGATVVQAKGVALTTLVILEVLQLGNSRSSTRSVFSINPLSNRFLLLGTLGALLLHVAAMYIPATQAVLDLEPLSLTTWLQIALASSSIVVVVEVHKLIRKGEGSIKFYRSLRSRLGGRDAQS